MNKGSTPNPKEDAEERKLIHLSWSEPTSVGGNWIT